MLAYLDEQLAVIGGDRHKDRYRIKSSGMACKAGAYTRSGSKVEQRWEKSEQRWMKKSISNVTYNVHRNTYTYIVHQRLHEMRRCN